MVTRAQLRLWFAKGLKPTELQFAAWLDSFWHKQDTIPAANVEGYQTLLDKRISSSVINEAGHLIITLSDGSTFDTGMAAGLPGADGENAVTPHIGENKNWFIGSVDTGIKAEGIDGVTPHIGVNGNWYFEAVDSGIKAQGVDGYTPIKGTDYFDGDNGKSAYELAVLGGFVGTESEWLTSLHGTSGYTPQKGTDYDDGIDGKSAYELALLDGFIGTEAEWLASLQGAPGTNGTNAPVTMAIYQIGANGMALPRKLPAYAYDRIISAVRLSSDCSGLSAKIGATDYNHITLVGVTIPANVELIINYLTVSAGNDSADALIIF